MSRTVTQYPSTYFEAQIEAELTDFRCQKCENRYPFSQLVIQDGARLCRANCACDYSRTETQQIVDDARVEAAQLTADTVAAAQGQLSEASNYSLMDGVAACTSIASGSTVYPTPIQVTSGGSPVSVVLTGVSFSVSDTITFDPAAGISKGASSISTDQTTNSFTVTITIKGDYDLLYNGTRFRSVFAAR